MSAKNLGMLGLNILGIVVVLFLMFLLSSKKKNINFKKVVLALAIQFVIAFILLKFEPGRQMIMAVSNFVTEVINCGSAGLQFVFGTLADPKAPTGMVFCITVLGNIVFLSALVALLYYLGILSFVVKWIGKGIGAIMGTTEVESFVAVANMFLGHTDSPVLVSKYLNKMTESEIMLVLISGMGSMSASILGGYHELGIPMSNLLIASTLVPFGSILISKIILPQTEKVYEIEDVKMDNKGDNNNIIEAISEGAMTGMQMALAIGASLIAVISLVTMVNKGLNALCGTSLEEIFSWVFAPIGYLMGFDWNTALKEGGLLGSKLVLNEFVAFDQLGQMIKELDPRTAMMMSVSLAGFANFASMGICVSGIAVLCPEKKEVLSRLVLKSMIGGFAVSVLSAMICGVVLLF